MKKLFLYKKNYDDEAFTCLLLIFGRKDLLTVIDNASIDANTKVVVVTELQLLACCADVTVFDNDIVQIA